MCRRSRPYSRTHALRRQNPQARRATDSRSIGYTSTPHRFAYDHPARAAAAFAGQDQRFDQRPVPLGQIAWIAQLAAVVSSRFSILHIGVLRRIRKTPLNHNRIIRFNNSPDRHLGFYEWPYVMLAPPCNEQGRKVPEKMPKIAARQIALAKD